MEYDPNDISDIINKSEVKGKVSDKDKDKEKPKKKRGRKSNKDIDKIENYDPEKTDDIDNLIINLKDSVTDSKNILPGYEFSEYEVQSDSEICCWNCCHSFTNITTAIPCQYIKEVFYINGHFCSYECGARYIFDSYNGSDMWDKFSLLNLYYNKTLGKSGVSIKPAPNKLSLTKFGGRMSIDEYRKVNDSNNMYFNVYLPPIIPISHNEYAYEGKVKTTDINNDLRLYRKKPMNSKNNIYDTMQLEVKE